MGRRLWGIAGLVLMVVGAGLVWHFLRGPGVPPDGGHLNVPPEHGYMFTQPVGSRFTDSFERLTVKGDRPVELIGVEQIGGEGLRVLGFKVLGPERSETRDFFPAYPPSLEDVQAMGAREILDGPGTVLEPGNEMGWELLVGYEILEDGPLWRDGLRITYRVGDQEYSVVYPGQIQVCTEIGQKGPEGRCRR